MISPATNEEIKVIQIIRVRNKDLETVLTLLRKVNLPELGVIDHFHNFFVALKGDHIIGCIGIEIYEDIGLIRSVAVHPSSQGHGLGHKLVETIHNFALERNLTEVYLLTETAEQFFLKQDYIVIPREEADPRVKKSIEFTSACPDSAVCMVKRLNK